MNPVVFAKLPRAGLANRLLVWGQAAVYAKRAGLQLFVHGWNHIHLGPWLRREKSKRFYGQYFRNESSTVRWTVSKVMHSLGLRLLVIDPPKDHASTSKELGTRSSDIIFKSVPSKADYFESIRGHESFLKTEFDGMISANLRQIAEQLPPLEIAIHVRRGDFRDAGFQITDESYFLDAFRKLKAVTDLSKATVFTDADPAELSNLLSLPGVSLGNHDHDLLDLIHLSRSRVLVTSLRSTFGYWAGFLSDAAIILHPEHASGRIRSDQLTNLFEGTIDHYVRHIQTRTNQVQ